MINAIIQYQYMQNAFFAAIMTSLICGVMGTIIVEKKLVSMTGGIAHASFGGVGAGYFFGIEPIIGALFFAVTASFGAGKIKRETKTNTDTIISIFWAAGMAIGIMFIAITPGYPPDMTSYLFGDILTVNRFYLALVFLMGLVIGMVVVGMFSYWKIFLFDEAYAETIGLPVKKLEIILYGLISLSIVVLIKVVGIILAIAMLTIPPAIGRIFFDELKSIMKCASVLGIIFSLVGLTLSYYLNIPSGATIIFVGIIGFFIAISIKNIRKTKK